MGLAMKIDLEELLEQLEEDCPNKDCVSGCYNCHQGKVLTKAGGKLLRFIELRLVPDARGGWDEVASRNY